MAGGREGIGVGKNLREAFALHYRTLQNLDQSKMQQCCELSSVSATYMP